MFSTRPKNRHVHLPEHGNALAHHAQRRLLRRADDHAAIQRHGLAERKLRVARARRQIHQQIIQVAPFHRQEELLDGLGDHRPAPDHRLVVVQQQADAHHFHAVGHRRHQPFVGADGRPLIDAHHQRNARTVNIAIQQAHPGAEMPQGAGQIGRAGGFAHAALAAGHGDDALARPGTLVWLAKAPPPPPAPGRRRAGALPPPPG